MIESISNASSANDGSGHVNFDLELDGYSDDDGLRRSSQTFNQTNTRSSADYAERPGGDLHLPSFEPNIPEAKPAERA